MIETAYINLWGKRVGAIAWDRNDQVGTFEFEPAFLRQHWDLAPIKMPIADAERRVFSFRDLRGNKTFKGLPGLLADVLPDKYGNALINAWLAQNGRAENSLNPVEMLCFIGERGMGAMEFEPVVPKASGRATKIEIESLVQIAQEILSGRQDFHTNLSDNEKKALMEILKVGTSAGGARAKALIAYNHDTGEVRSGQALAPKGFTHWLIKFDGVKDDQLSSGSGALSSSSGYGRVEMAYHNMAVNCGIEMTECRVLEENDRAHFMTKRFDRIPGRGKVHVQTFCAIQHFDFAEITSFSYEQLFQTMRILRLSAPRMEQLFRRMVFNVIARNCDDHTKNFAFIMDKKGQWDLSPAYDLCHAYRPGSPWVSQQSLSVNGKRQGISTRDLLEVAQEMNVKKPEPIIDEMVQIVGRWMDYAAKQKVPDGIARAINSTLLV
jgi:serine/threonine-protein kinase HipA